MSNHLSKNALFEKEALAYRDSIYGMALKLTKNDRDAEDLVQDTLVKAYNHFDSFEPGTNCKAWLFKILTNTFINRYRKQQREHEMLSKDGEYARNQINRETSNVEQVYTPEDVNYMSEFGDEVQNALALIPEDFRFVVMCADLQDYSYKEIASMVGCPIGTIMSRLFRGRQILKKHLKNYAESLGYDISDSETALNAA